MIHKLIDSDEAFHYSVELAQACPNYLMFLTALHSVVAFIAKTKVML